MNVPLPSYKDDRPLLDYPAKTTTVSTASQTQVGGNHYEILDPQPWDVYANWFGKDGFRGYVLGTIIKYIARYRNKNGVEDLEKAKHFLNKLIEFETKETKCQQTS
jgi:hypothetical protein